MPSAKVEPPQPRFVPGVEWRWYLQLWFMALAIRLLTFISIKLSIIIGGRWLKEIDKDLHGDSENFINDMNDLVKELLKDEPDSHS